MIGSLLLFFFFFFFFFLLNLSLCAGGIKSNVITMGGDQFNLDYPEESAQKDSYFQYFCKTLVFVVTRLLDLSFSFSEAFLFVCVCGPSNPTPINDHTIMLPLLFTTTTPLHTLPTATIAFHTTRFPYPS